MAVIVHGQGLEQAAEDLERVLKQLRAINPLIAATFGSTAEEVAETRKAVAGLSPCEIREACWAFKAQRAGRS